METPALDSMWALEGAKEEVEKIFNETGKGEEWLFYFLRANWSKILRKEETKGEHETDGTNDYLCCSRA